MKLLKRVKEVVDKLVRHFKVKNGKALNHSGDVKLANLDKSMKQLLCDRIFIFQFQKTYP